MKPPVRMSRSDPVTREKTGSPAQRTVPAGRHAPGAEGAGR